MNSIKLSAAALIVSSSTFADFTGATYTVENLVAGYDTYKVFVNFSNPLDKMLAVNGDLENGYAALSYNGGELYNVGAFGILDDDTGQYQNTPGANVLGDSFLTLGDQASDVQFSPNFLGGVAGQSVVNGTSFIQENNGGYFDSNPGTGIFDGGSGVLIAQLTVASGEDITFTGTASFNDANGGLTAAAFSVTTVPAPGALALLGLAGLGRRRRS